MTFVCIHIDNGTFIYNQNVKGWENAYQINPYVYNNNTQRFNQAMIVKVRTTVTPPTLIAGKLCKVKCVFAALYTQSSPFEFTTTTAHEIFLEMTSPHSQYYRTNPTAPVQDATYRSNGLQGGTPALAVLMNNIFYSTGDINVNVPAGPFELVVKLRRPDYWPVSRSGAEPFDPANPNIKSNSFPLGRLTCILEFTPVF